MPDLQEPVSGESLRKMLSQKITHEPLASLFLYKNATLMISSQPAVGKSVLAIQAALQLSNGLPLFGGLNVPNPLRVWYIQMERPITECLERLQLMIGNMNLSLDNLFIDVELQSLNFLNPKDFQLVIQRGEKIKPDVIIIDPLYGIATGLSRDDVGANVAKMFTVMKKHFNCALWVNHHTVKNPYEIIEGHKVPKDDPFYGAQWLKAHITASYLATQEKEGVMLICKKDSHSNLLKEIKLCFDDDTYISTMNKEHGDYTDRYKLYLNSKYNSINSLFDFEEARQFLGCAPTTLRELNRTPLFSTNLSLLKHNGRKTLYTVIKEF